MLTIETKTPGVDVGKLTERIEKEIARVKMKKVPPRRISLSIDRDSYKVPEPPKIAIKDRYRIEELLAYQGDNFVCNAFRAIIQESVSPEVMEKYRQLYYQGIVSKKELLVKLRYSPDGRRKNVIISGILPAYLLQILYKIPLFGYGFRVVVSVLRLPVTIRNVQRLNNMLIACQEELKTKVDAEEYLNNLQRVNLAFQVTDQRMLDFLQEDDQEKPTKHRG